MAAAAAVETAEDARNGIGRSQTPAQASTHGRAPRVMATALPPSQIMPQNWAPVPARLAKMAAATRSKSQKSQDIPGATAMMRTWVTLRG